MRIAGQVGATALGDRLAIGASLLCVAHCLVLPLVFAALPALAAVLPVPESLHTWMVAFAAPVSLLALLGGRRRHRGGVPLMLGMVGLVLMLAALAITDEGFETGLTVLGSLLLASGHLRNLRQRGRVARS